MAFSWHAVKFYYFSLLPLTSCRIQSARQRLASVLGQQFTSMAARSPAWLLEHTTASWSQKYGHLYRYACIVDVTFLKTTKSGNVWVSQKSFSHYKGSWGVAVMRIVAMDGSVILNGEPIPASEPKGWANLDVSWFGFLLGFCRCLSKILPGEGLGQQ